MSGAAQKNRKSFCFFFFRKRRFLLLDRSDSGRESAPPRGSCFVTDVGLRRGGRGAGDARAGEGERAWARAQAAVGAGADDPEDRVFADEVGAVVRVAQDGCRGGEGAGLGEGRGVPGAGQEVRTGEEAGKEGEDQGLDGMTQARAGSAVPWKRNGGLALRWRSPGRGGSVN